MDIGTGKIPVNQPQTQVTKTPDHYEINHIPVWGYDLINPDQEFSSYDFAVYAKEKIADIVGRGKTPSSNEAHKNQAGKVLASAPGVGEMR